MLKRLLTESESEYILYHKYIILKPCRPEESDSADQPQRPSSPAASPEPSPSMQPDEDQEESDNEPAVSLATVMLSF